MRDLEIVPDSLLHPSADRPTFIDRLANSLTKRKRSTPQKFVGKGLLPPQHGQMGERGGGGGMRFTDGSRSAVGRCRCSHCAFHPAGWGGMG